MKLIALLRISRSFFILLTAIILSVILCKSSFSQSILKIYGQVIDYNGPAANVIVEIKELSLQATTGHDGYYYIYNIPPGKYKLTFRKDDIIMSTGDKIMVVDGPPIRRDIFLEHNVLNIAPVYATTSSMQSTNYHGYNVKIYDIEKQTVESVEAILKEIPGLNVVNSPATGEIFISANGVRPEGINVLIDGRKINSLLTGKADLNQIPASAVTKIEYISPGAATPTTDGSLGGTVNFITLQGDRSNSLSASLVKGSYDAEGYNAGLDCYKPKYGSLKIIWDKWFADNDYSYTDYFGESQKRQNARSRYEKYYLSYSNSINDNFISISGFVYSGNNGIPGRTITPLTEANSQKETISIGGEYSRKLNKSINIKTTLSILKRENRYEDLGSFFSYNTKYLEQETKFALSSSYTNAEWLDIHSGLSAAKSVLEGIDYIRPESALGKKNRDVYRFDSGIGIRQQISKFAIKSGISYSINLIDRSNYSSSSISISALYQSRVSAGFTSSFSNSFRLPGLAELHWREDVFVIANPDLKPEKSKSLATEIFSDFKLIGKWHASLEYRDVRYKDLIYWRRSQGIKYKPVNVSASDFFSITGTINYKAPADIIEINFSRVRSIPLNREDDELYYGKYIIHQPLYTNRLGIRFNYRILRAGADMFDSSHRFITEENTKQLDCYTLVNLYAGLALKINIITAIFEFKVNNLTDIEYELLEYQPMPPRNYNINLTLKM